MPYNQYNIMVLQGETFRRNMVWSDASGTPVDMTNRTGRMHLRRVITDPIPAFELTTENGRIALGGVNGSIDLLVSAADTSSLSGEYVYDLEIVNGLEVQRVLQGKVSVNAEVTR